MAVNLPVRKLAKLCNPFSNPWTTGRFSAPDVRRALAEGRLRSEAFGMATVEWTLTEHIERIAFLVHYGWSEAVAVDVGVPSLGCVVNWPLTDGNHRLGAALVRGDDVIAASVAGDIDYAFRLFGVDVRESDFETVPA